MHSQYGMMAGKFGMGVLCLIYFMLFSFVFSVIFWLTHKWIGKKK